MARKYSKAGRAKVAKVAKAGARRSSDPIR
jgi:hypothetical protein